MEKQTAIILISLALVVGVGIGYGGSEYGTKAPVRGSAVGVVRPPAVPTPGIISGTVKEVNGNTVAITLTGDKAGETGKVTVTSDTTIVKMERKAADAYQKELTAFRSTVAKLQASSSTSPMPAFPARIYEAPAKISDVAVGVRVTAQAKDTSVTGSSFEVSKITIQLPPVAFLAPAVPNTLTQ